MKCNDLNEAMNLLMKAILKSVCQRVCQRHLSTARPSDFVLKNPCDAFKEYLQGPLFHENEAPFSPSLLQMQKAQKLFVPQPKHKIKFLLSAYDESQFPVHNLPEVTFIGRSNVGKSSLLKAILSSAPSVIVKTSKAPGHTRSVNFYQIGESLYLVDLPGYGYKQPRTFVETVEDYIRRRPNLKRTFLMIDGKVGFQPWDQVAMEMLEEFGVPYALIMTKIDKCSLSRRLENLLRLKEIRDHHAGVCCFPQPFLLSAITQEGLGYLQAFIAHITGNLDLDSG